MVEMRLWGFCLPTCAHDAGKHPALPVLDRVAVRLLPAPQDVHTAVPVGGAEPSGKRVAPVSQHHPAVIVAIYLMVREQSLWCRHMRRVSGMHEG